MSRENVLKELQSDKKYLSWKHLTEYANTNDYAINYGNKYTSWLKINDTQAICIDCQNVYGSQMIKSFK